MCVRRPLPPPPPPPRPALPKCPAGGARALRSAAHSHAAAAKHRRCGARTPSKARQLETEARLAKAKKRLSRARMASPMELDIRFTIFTTVPQPTLNTSNVPEPT